MAELLRYPNHPSNYGMTAWERLERYGSIKNFRRKMIHKSTMRIL